MNTDDLIDWLERALRDEPAIIGESIDSLPKNAVSEIIVHLRDQKARAEEAEKHAAELEVLAKEYAMGVFDEKDRALLKRAEEAEAQAAAMLDVVDRLHTFLDLSPCEGGPLVDAGRLMDDLNAALEPQAGARLVARLRALENVAQKIYSRHHDHAPSMEPPKCDCADRLGSVGVSAR